VNTLEGDLVVDRTLFRPARFDVGLPPFDEAPEFPYNVIPDALHLAGSLLTVDLDSSSGSVRAQAMPALPGLVFTSRMALTTSACKDWDDDWKPATVQRDGAAVVIELQGGFPSACRQRAELQLIDRLELTERLFRSLWQGLGGSWAGRAREAAAPVGTRLLVRRQSRTWGEVLRPMNKTSDNAHTRLLYLLLGVPAMATEPQANTTDLAAREVRRWLAEHDIGDGGLVLDNGSGLSRSERITPWQLASMLKAAHAGPHASDLAMSMPVVGVDGTMRNRMKDSPAAGWARLKTGTLRNVVALAGYVKDPQGQAWAVSMMINHDAASKARPALLALVDHFARVGPHGSATAPAPAASSPPAR
jgi:D-alanyl-D-alanine carboxypeptidase/D-alanyl-D-alanine-endopeptidase (penicillin-binding protein 4)